MTSIVKLPAASRDRNGGGTSRRPTARPSRSAAVALVLASVAAALGIGRPAVAAELVEGEPAPPPTISSGNGITVLEVAPVDARTFDVRVQTPLVSEFATRVGNGVRITLPEGYDPASPRRYPVLYLLHGASSSYRSWYRDSAADILASSSSDLIVVMPDGGKFGMYTDWVDQSRYQQDWMTYHLDQLVPFIDRNLNTVDDRASRAIAGVSMGGNGAMHYAFARPDLFGAAASTSGLLNPLAPASAASLPVMTSYWGLPAFGQYGLPFWPYWGAWHDANPVEHAAQLRDVRTFLYVGKGTDPAELEVRSETEAMSRALTRAGVAHTFVNYGTAGSCNGGHTVACAGYGLSLALPKLREALSLPPV